VSFRAVARGCLRVAAWIDAGALNN